MVGKVAGIVDAAEAAAAKAAVHAPVGKPAVTEARRTAMVAARVAEATKARVPEAATVETPKAATMKAAPETTTECRGTFYPNGDAGCHRRSRQQCANQFPAVREMHRHRLPPHGSLAAATFSMDFRAAGPTLARTPARRYAA